MTGDDSKAAGLRDAGQEGRGGRRTQARLQSASGLLRERIVIVAF